MDPPPVIRRPRQGLVHIQVQPKARPTDPLSLTTATTFKDTTEFREHVEANASVYANYSVVSLTRSKDLEDDKYHEFLTFLVIDKRDKSFSKIFCDRGYSADFTTLGKHNTIPIITPVEENATAEALIHILPLQTLLFADNDRPSVLFVAKTLEQTHTIAPQYSKWRHHCFWYAGTVFAALQREFTTSTLTNWSYWSTNSYIVPKLGKGSVCETLVSSVVILPNKP